MRIITYAVLDMETMQWVYEESFDYQGPVALACGATDAQKSVQNQDLSFMQELDSQHNQEFGESQDIMNDLKGQLQSIVNAGSSQNGFSAAETAALNTGAIDRAAGAVAQESTALNDSLAAKGGGNEYAPSGATQELNAELASSAENELANEQNQNAVANAQAGQQKFFTAENAEANLPGQVFSPLTGGADAGVSAGSTAGQQANQVAAAGNSWEGLLTGALGGATSSLVSGGMSNLGKGVGFFGQNA